MKNKRFFMEDGRIYFSKKMERKIFFIMTLVMFGLAVITKMGLL